MKFEVFIHKIDGLTEDNKIETQRDIHQRAMDDLSDSGMSCLSLIGFLLFLINILITSIF